MLANTLEPDPASLSSTSCDLGPSSACLHTRACLSTSNHSCEQPLQSKQPVPTTAPYGVQVQHYTRCTLSQEPCRQVERLSEPQQTIAAFWCGQPCHPRDKALVSAMRKGSLALTWDLDSRAPGWEVPASTPRMDAPPLPKIDSSSCLSMSHEVQAAPMTGLPNPQPLYRTIRSSNLTRVEQGLEVLEGMVVKLSAS